MTKLNQKPISGMTLTNNEIDAIIGRNVKSRRVALGISQTELGRTLGITFQQVQKYEKGANRLSGSRMHQTAAALSCEEQDFFKGLNKQSSVLDASMKAVLAYRDSPQGIQLVRLMAAMQDPSVRNKIVALAKAIAEKE